MQQVLVMVKQLEKPTFVPLFSCAGLQWKELISIIVKINGIDIADEDIDKPSYHERCDTLNNNPV